MKKLKTIVFDIETVGEDFEMMDETSQRIMTHWIEKEAKNEEDYEKSLNNLKNEMGLSPLTGFIVAVGVLEVESQKGAVYYQAPEKKIADFEENGIKYIVQSEKEILESFWSVVKRAESFVSFNGRGFDVPFLMIRSAVHGIRPSKNLLSNRYLSMQKFGAKHIDLMDQLTFYGAMWKKPNLHMCCRALGVKSPKEDGMDGNLVAKLFKNQEYENIARYNVGDLFSTAGVFEKWKNFLDV